MPASVPDEGTWAPGLVTDAILNTRIRDPLAHLMVPPFVHAYRSSAFTLSHNTHTVVGLFGEVWDRPDPNHSTVASESRMTVGTPGYWQFSARATFASSTAGLRRGAYFRQNAVGSPSGGTALVESYVTPVSSVLTTVAIAPFDIALSVGDYLELFVFQDSGADMTVYAGQWSTYVQARWVGRL